MHSETKESSVTEDFSRESEVLMQICSRLNTWLLLPGRQSTRHLHLLHGHTDCEQETQNRENERLLAIQDTRCIWRTRIRGANSLDGESLGRNLIRQMRQGMMPLSTDSCGSFMSEVRFLAKRLLTLFFPTFARSSISLPGPHTHIQWRMYFSSDASAGSMSLVHLS